jgi:hypothetical protein
LGGGEKTHQENQMRLIFVFYFLILSTVSCSARIGEGLGEISQRYGNPIAYDSTGDPRISKGSYSWHGFDVSVMFLDGKSSRESFSKSEDGTMAVEELEAIKTANAPKWIEIENEPDAWTTPDKKLICVFSEFTRHGNAIVITQELLTYLGDQKKKNTEGL